MEFSSPSLPHKDARMPLTRANGSALHGMRERKREREREREREAMPSMGR